MIKVIEVNTLSTALKINDLHKVTPRKNNLDLDAVMKLLQAYLADNRKLLTN